MTPAAPRMASSYASSLTARRPRTTPATGTSAVPSEASGPCQRVAEPGEKVAVGLDNLVDLLHPARGLGAASVGNEKDPVTVDENS
jgi:hypothetical protein